MDIKLIAFDLDGTFLDDKKEIPPENLEALKAAAERGIHIVPATGRLFIGVHEAIKQLPFVRYYILVNGAQVYDAWEDKTIYRGEIPLDMALSVMDYMETLPVIFDCYQHDCGWMSQHMFDRIDEFVPNPAMSAAVKKQRRPVPDLRSTLIERGDSVQKQQMFFKDLDEMRRQRDEILPGLFPELLPSTSVVTNIELNHVSAGKDKGLEALCTHLGFALENAMAFGDGTNDTCMIKAAGMGVAMSNAEKEVLAAADYITLSNNEAGVAAAIERFVLS